ncbi:TetR/AcrR family transcriptional regulator [Demequina aurantiaca]|uniref:TetR/AcrR family transcriptional regulator n=1 Tax=Demequina aurantiaca TaxID=676200 RepID=UPI003D34A444
MKKRSDARSNHAGILRAAEEVFAAESVDVPLQRIAERAGVGRGTLYRHFPNRFALAAALYEDRLARYEELVRLEGDNPEIVLTLLSAVTAEQGRIPGLFGLIFADGPGQTYLDPLWQRSIALFTGPLRISQAAGTVRADLTVDDLLMVVGMVFGVLNSPAGLAGPEAATRALDLAQVGLRPRQP